MSGSGAQSSADRASRRGSRFAGTRAAALARLSELDREILCLVSWQRVLTQTQLARLLVDAPERTLRYRTERLYQLGLLGRSRPYRDSGSHPFHLWPTRQADAYVRGEPAPQGGERVEPNPLFLAHAAGLSELYVLLATGMAEGLTLRGFRREGEAREAFRAGGRERTLAPDCLLDLRDEQGRQLLAGVELDLGTMSRPRLRVKASGYAAYADQAAWAERHPFCPTLLFLTTSEARAFAFLKLLAGELKRLGRGHWYGNEEDWFTAAACAHAHAPTRALSEPCWDDNNLSSGLTLRDCLEQARRPYEQARAEENARQRERGRRHTELLADPETLRRHLRSEQRFALSRVLERFGEQGALALQLLLAHDEPLHPCERDALLALAHLLGDQLLDVEEAKPDPPSTTGRASVERLVDHYRQRQHLKIAALVRRYGEGPRLREQLQRLQHDKLLDQYTDRRLEDDARHDSEARHQQDRLRRAYLDRRDRESRRRARANGLTSYLLHGTADAYAQVDRDRLQICPRCQEIAYPPEHDERSGYGFNPALRQCHFCAGTALQEWDERWTPLLETGPAVQAVALDLRPSGIDGFMDAPKPSPDQEPHR